MSKIQRAERRIVGRIIDDALAAGYSLSVDYGDNDRPIKKSKDRAKILAELFACDEERIIFHGDDALPVKSSGWALLVHGNGWCVLSDYTANLETVLAGANKLADELDQEDAP